jgi:hypothetical protein
LLDEARMGPRGARRRPIVGWSAEPRDGGVGVKPPQFVAPDAFQMGGRVPPGLDPLSSAGNLFGRPRCERGRA